MIVTSTENGWELIFQPSHGLLAAKIAAQFDEEHQSSLWFETVAAINVHDDFKGDASSEQDQYVTAAGAPRDFTLIEMDSDQRLVQAEKKVTNAYRKHQWAGLLESTHMEFLYGEQDVSNGMNDLLSRERDRRKRTLKKLGWTKSDLEYSYALMRWCDRCSLILCQQKLPAMQRRLEIISIDETEYDIWQRDDGEICVTPWPFLDSEFSVNVEVYVVEKLKFAGDDELLGLLDSIVPQNRSWNFRRE